MVGRRGACLLLEGAVVDGASLQRVQALTQMSLLISLSSALCAEKFY